MKALCFLIFLLFVSPISYGQDFYVVHVKGEISAGGQALKPGDKFNSTDELKFLSQDATVVVMSPLQGRMVLDGQKAEKNAKGEFIGLARYLLVPMKKNMQMSTRGSEDEAILDLKSYFGEGAFVVIGEEISVLVDQKQYPQTANKVFIFRYQFEGKDIPKVMDSQAGKLIINKNRLFQSNGQSINPEEIDSIDIYYGEKSTRNFSKITTIKAVFLENELLAKELTSLINFLSEKMKMNEEEIKKELSQYMIDVHGKTDLSAFFAWISEKKLL